MTLDSLTVAGAAPALQDESIPRTGFPFNPSACKAAGHPNSKKIGYFKTKKTIGQSTNKLGVSGQGLFLHRNGKSCSMVFKPASKFDNIVLIPSDFRGEISVASSSLEDSGP